MSDTMAKTAKSDEVKSMRLPANYIEALDRVAARKYAHIPEGRRFSVIVREILFEYLVKAKELKER
jgi:hypothetical protein